MSQAFLNGMRSVRGMGMGDIRQDFQRQDDQNNTVSGNPALASNIRAVRPMPGAQQAGAPLPQRRYMPPTAPLQGGVAPQQQVMQPPIGYQPPQIQPTPAGGQQMTMPVAPIQGPLPPGKNGMPMRANPQGGYPVPQYIQSFGQNNPNRRYLMK